jgi:hypothetical protein
MTRVLLATDPGNCQSAYVFVDVDSYKPLSFFKEDNDSPLTIFDTNTVKPDASTIEMVSSYGMTVGKEVFETCVWIGKITTLIEIYLHVRSSLLYRKDVKMNLCGSMRAKDSNIIQALKDRFGDKGTKKNPGWFYGFSKDIWQAYALAVTWIDIDKGLYKC